MAETHGEKVKEVELQIPETQWSMCKADAHVNPSANKLENNTLGNTLPKVEAELLVVTQVEMLAEVKVQTLARL